MIEMGKGKCACGKLIDQVNSLISFVIVIAFVCVGVGEREREPCEDGQLFARL